jgi:hypothetical protein
MSSNLFFFLKPCRLWDNIEKCDGAREATEDNIIRLMRFACWVGKATLTRARTQKYVIIFAFPRQQWFRERGSVLRYIYVHCLSCSLSLVHKDLPSLAVVFILRITDWIIKTSVVLLDVHVLLELETFDDHRSVRFISTYCCKIRNFLGLCGWACSAGGWGGVL